MHFIPELSGTKMVQIASNIKLYKLSVVMNALSHLVICGDFSPIRIAHPATTRMEYHVEIFPLNSCL